MPGVAHNLVRFVVQSLVRERTRCHVGTLDDELAYGGSIRYLAAWGQVKIT